MIYLFGITKYDGVMIREKTLLATFNAMEDAIKYIESCKQFKNGHHFQFKGLLYGFDDYELSDCIHNPPLEPEDSGIWL